MYATDEQLKRKAKAIVDDPRVYKDYGGHLQWNIDNVRVAAANFLKDPNTMRLSSHGDHRHQFKLLLGTWEVMLEPALNVLPQLYALRKQLDSGYIDDPALDLDARERTEAYLDLIHNSIFSFNRPGDYDEIFAFLDKEVPDLIRQIKKKTLAQRLGFRSVRPS